MSYTARILDILKKPARFSCPYTRFIGLCTSPQSVSSSLKIAEIYFLFYMP